jgi:hypothetical protein
MSLLSCLERFLPTLFHRIQGGLAAEGLGRAIRVLRQLHLQVELFNMCYGLTVYLCKLIALLGCIIGGFGAIVLMENNPRFAAIFGLFFLDGILLYTVIFGRAYRITDTAEELKREILMAIPKLRLKTQRDKCKRILRSIPWLGVRDGLYKLNRQSVFVFTDFAVGKIVDLVLTFL